MFGLQPADGIMRAGIETFRLLDFVAGGGSGQVFRAQLLKPLNRLPYNAHVALKFMDLDTTSMAAVTSELGLLAQVQSDYVPMYYDVFQTTLVGKSVVVIVMQYIAGDSLDAVLDRCLRQNNRALSEKYVVDVLSAVLGTLSDIHKVLVHRDLKPANLRFDSDGKLYVLDFGIAKTTGQMTRTSAAGYGTSGFAAPEQLRVRGSTNDKTDVYGIAATAYMLLTGNAPADCMERLADISQGQIDPLIDLATFAHVSQSVAAAIMWGLTLRQDQRPTVREFHAALLGHSVRAMTSQSPVAATTVSAANQNGSEGQLILELQALYMRRARNWDISLDNEIEKKERELARVTGNRSTKAPATAEILREMRRTLQQYRLQAAMYGMSTPPHITTTIEDIEKEMQRLGDLPQMQSSVPVAAQVVSGPTIRLSATQSPHVAARPAAARRLSAGDIAHRLMLIQNLRRRLVLEVDTAKSRWDTGHVTHVLTQIDDERQQIAGYKQDIRAEGEVVQDEAIDFIQSDEPWH